eukprot:364300-Chlamydomonas_euryale.AAC.8
MRRTAASRPTLSRRTPTCEAHVPLGLLPTPRGIAADPEGLYFGKPNSGSEQTPIGMRVLRKKQREIE